MTGSRITISLCVLAASVGALANASYDDGYGKATVQPRTIGFRKATTVAPDPSLRQVQAQEPVQQQIEILETAPAQPVAEPASIASQQVPVTPDDGGVPPTRPTTSYEAPVTITPKQPAAVIAPKPAIQFVAPNPISGFSTGCTDLPCGEPQCQTCQTQTPAPCTTCSPATPCVDCQPIEQNRRSWRLFQRRQRRPRMNRRRSISAKRRRWWPWLATNDMPVPQSCQCPACSGVPVSGCTTAVMPVTPQVVRSATTESFPMLSELNQLEATPIAAKPIQTVKQKFQGADFGPLDAAETSTLKRVARRFTRPRIMPVSKRLEERRSEQRSTSVLPSHIGVWQTK